MELGCAGRGNLLIHVGLDPVVCDEEHEIGCRVTLHFEIYIALDVTGGNMSQSTQRGSIRLHFFYVTLILSLSIIALVTNDWTKLQGFTEYLNVAATVTSLVLGLLAIIYAFVSTGAMNQFLGSIQGSTSAINRIAGEMRETLITGQEVQSRADTRTEELHNLAQSLAVSLSSLDESTQSLCGKVESIPTQLTALQETITSSSNTSQTSGNSDVSAVLWTSDHVALFLKKASQYGLVALRGIIFAKDRGEYLDVAKLDDVALFMYGYGYLLALQATGLIKLEYPGKETDLHAVRLHSAPDIFEKLVAAEVTSRKANKKKAAYLLSREAAIEKAIHDGTQEVAAE